MNLVLAKTIGRSAGLFGVMKCGHQTSVLAWPDLLFQWVQPWGLHAWPDACFARATASKLSFGVQKVHLQALCRIHKRLGLRVCHMMALHGGLNPKPQSDTQSPMDCLHQTTLSAYGGFCRCVCTYMTHISLSDSLVIAEGCYAFANWTCISSETPFLRAKTPPRP